MFFRQSEKKAVDDDLRKIPARAARLYSLPALSRGRQFKGNFELGGKSYEFIYAPAKASVAGRRLRLHGLLTVTTAHGQPRTRQTTAMLVGTQGGIGTAPTRPGNLASGATASAGLPEVESTGASSFCGVMYIHFEPLSGSALGVAGDLSRVQMNVRFAPVNDAERSVQAAYSSVVDALSGKQIDASASSAAIRELNKLLASG
ncbi:MAG: hypothetical protein WAV20_00205 [Blastocatellia bacterium]